MTSDAELAARAQRARERGARAAASMDRARARLELAGTDQLVALYRRELDLHARAVVHHQRAADAQLGVWPGDRGGGRRAPAG